MCYGSSSSFYSLLLHLHHACIQLAFQVCSDKSSVCVLLKILLYVDHDWLLTLQVVEGIVVDVGWYRTTIRSFEREIFNIPNSVFSRNVVLNITRKGKEWRFYEFIGRALERGYNHAVLAICLSVPAPPTISLHVTVAHLNIVSL